MIGLALFVGCIGFEGSSEELEEAAVGVEGLSLVEIEDRLTDPVYEVVEQMQTRVEMDDGTEVGVEIFYPGDAEEPVPVILTKTPYHGLGAALSLAGNVLEGDPAGERPHSPGLVEYFVPRGYAVATADARGTYNSDGCHDHKGWEQGEDAARVVEWLASEEWTNGKVGMIGGSYEGYTQLATAVHQPEGLATIVPAVSVNAQYSYIYYEGVPYGSPVPQGAGTTSAYFGVSAVPGDDPEAFVGYHERLLCQEENYRENLDPYGDYSEYWAERDMRPYVDKIDVPVLQVHGHEDWNVKPDNIDGIFNEITSEKRLIIGQFGHSYPDRDDWELILHRWFDHHLQGIDTGILADLPPVLSQDSTGQYRALDAYPPTSTDTVTLWPGSGGVLSFEPVEEGVAMIHDWPRNTNLFVDDGTAQAGEAATGHPEELVFGTEPLEEDLHYTGRPMLELRAATDAERTHWAVELIVEHEGEEESINYGFLNTRHMNGVGNETVALEPGEVYDATVPLYPQDDVIPAGATLTLVLSNDHGMIQQADTYAESSVFYGPDALRLVFPVAPDGEAVPTDALREDLAS